MSLSTPVILNVLEQQVTCNTLPHSVKQLLLHPQEIVLQKQQLICCIFCPLQQSHFQLKPAAIKLPRACNLSSSNTKVNCQAACTVLTKTNFSEDLIIEEMQLPLNPIIPFKHEFFFWYATQQM